MAPIAAVSDLPIAQANLHGHAQKASNADAAAVADRRSSQAEFAVLCGHVLHNLSKRIDIHGAAQEAFPEDDQKDEVDRRQEAVEVERLGG